MHGSIVYTVYFKAIQAGHAWLFQFRCNFEVIKIPVKLYDIQKL